jgi:hypothetical protein
LVARGEVIFPWRIPGDRKTVVRKRLVKTTAQSPRAIPVAVTVAPRRPVPKREIRARIRRQGGRSAQSRKAGVLPGLGLRKVRQVALVRV